MRDGHTVTGRIIGSLRLGSMRSLLFVYSLESDLRRAIVLPHAHYRHRHTHVATGWRWEGSVAPTGAGRLYIPAHPEWDFSRIKSKFDQMGPFLRGVVMVGSPATVVSE